MNLALVMLLGGLWHGASWNFVIWGGFHGGMLALERLAGKDSLYRRLPGWLRTAVTFVLVCLSWVFFRAEDLPTAATYLASMFGVGSPAGAAGLLPGIMYHPYSLLCLFLAALLVWTRPDSITFTRRVSAAKAAYCLAAFLVAVVVLTTQEYNPFIYFIF